MAKHIVQTVRIGKRKIPVNRLECADYGHRWEPWTAERHGKVFDQGMRCSRCKVKRERKIDANNGDVVKNWTHDYSEAPGYLVAGGRLTPEEKAVIRIVNLRKAVR